MHYLNCLNGGNLWILVVRHSHCKSMVESLVWEYPEITWRSIQPDVLW